MNHSEMEFYWGVASGSSRRALSEAGGSGVTEHSEGRTVDRDEYPAPEYAMVSYATKMNEPFEGPEWMVDCGGYSVLSGHGEYETTCHEYVEWVAERDEQIAWWALRDWPYVEDLIDGSKTTVRDFQRQTVRDHIRCLEAADELGVDARPMAVLQGRDVRDYLWHVDYLREHGLLTDRVMIGSLVRGPGTTAEVRSTITQIREALPTGTELHGLGVKKQLLSDEHVVNALDSADSAAWNSSLASEAMAAGSTGNARFTWDRVMDAYASYRDELRERFDAAAASDAHVTVTRLGQWSAAPDVDPAQYALYECLCGALVDPNVPRPEPVGGKCRHCRRAAVNMTNRKIEQEAAEARAESGTAAGTADAAPTQQPGWS